MLEHHVGNASTAQSPSTNYSEGEYNSYYPLSIGGIIPKTKQDDDMEKIFYVLWRDPKVDQESFARTLRTEIADRLLEQGVHGLQINATDSAVSASTNYYVSTHPQMEAALHLWVDCHLPKYRQPFDDIIARGSGRFAAYLVTESLLLRNTKHIPEPGARSYGMAMIGMGHRPAHLSYEAYVEKMFEYGPIAMASLATFSYQQNIVTRVLTPGAPQFASLVEECFPEESITDPYALYGATGDEEKYQRNMNAMIEGIASFTDWDKVDAFPTSQYLIKSVS
jgi:hypothetical protein